MPVKHLKSIFRKGGSSHKTITQLIDSLGGAAVVEDVSGKILAGEKGDGDIQKFPVQVNGTLLGHVYGPELLFQVVQTIAEKEQEKKILGNEILALYREINLIYNFSEKLSNAGDKETIGALALEEAKSIITSSCGMVVINEPSISALASFGCEDSSQIIEGVSALFNTEQIEQDKSSILNQIDASSPLHSICEARSLVLAPLKIKDVIRGYIVLMNSSDAPYSAGDMKLLSTIALMSASSIETSMLYEKNLEEVKQRELQLTRMNNVMTKFVPHQFIQALGHKQIFDVKLGDKVEREVTIFFSDIRDYTTLSERMTLTENFDFIGDYHQAVGPVIRNFDGFITQYLGDGIMAVFPRTTDDAVSAAIQMQEIITDHNARSDSRNRVNVGMGMHTGPLIMGVVGDPDRMNPATIADTVNSASRMEGSVQILRIENCGEQGHLPQAHHKGFYRMALPWKDPRQRQGPRHGGL